MQYKIVVQSRYGSTRLPGKALYPMAGMPMIVFLLRRLKALGFGDHLVLATTANEEDDTLAVWGASEGVDVVRGEADDVLARFLRCADDETDFLVRVTGDNPLTDQHPLNAVIEAIQSGGHDYVAGFDGYPVGVGVDAFTCESLRRIAAGSDDPRHREHLNAYHLDHPDALRCLHLSAPDELTRPDLRLTVDTPEEWAFVAAVLDQVDEPLTMSVRHVTQPQPA